MPYKITFNGVDMPSFLKVKTVDFPVFAEPSVNILSKTGGIGGLFAGTTLGTKKIKVKIMIVPQKNSDTLASMARELGNWLMGNMWKPSELVFSDDPNIFYDAVVDSSVDITDLLFAGDGEISFVVPSGVGRGAIHGNVATIDYTNKIATMVYDGTAPSSAYIYYHLSYSVVPADNWTMTVQETGDTLKIANFMSGGVTYIDCEKRRINSTTNPPTIKDLVLVQNKWINFPKKGTYQITWNFSSNCTLQISCTNYYY